MIEDLKFLFIYLAISFYRLIVPYFSYLGPFNILLSFTSEVIEVELAVVRLPDLDEVKWVGMAVVTLVEMNLVTLVELNVVTLVLTSLVIEAYMSLPLFVIWVLYLT